MLLLHSFLSVVYLLRQNILRKYKISNCLSKGANKSFILDTPPLTSGRLKKSVAGMHKNHIKYFTIGIHQIYGYERFTQN